MYLDRVLNAGGVE